MLINTS